MRAQRGHRKALLRNFLDNYLHSRMAASSSALLAALLCSVNVSAEPRTWLNGSAFDPAAQLTRNLPIPVAGADGIKSFISAGELTDSTGKAITSVEQFQLLLNSNDKIMRIDQASGKVILNWQSFDIAAGYEVKFVQPSSTSLALNQISNSTSPSRILGNLTANGGVYLINANGILFGQDSQINVGSLVASSLNVDSDLFLNKSLSKAMTDDNKSAFTIKNTNGELVATKGDVLKIDLDAENNVQLDANNSKKASLKTYAAEGNAADLRGDIVFAEGAEINTSTLNGMVAVAPNVVNEGTIKTSDGQTILAAAQDEAFVLFSTDPSLRGLLIEVNAGGNVTNLGNIVAERGNITLAGIAVNMGENASARATTSVDFNGSVRLIARDSLALDQVIPKNITALEQVSALLSETPNVNEIGRGSDGENHYRVASRGGKVNLGAHSTIEVAAELSSGKTAPDAQEQAVSGVEIAGNSIHLAAGASITAKGGQVFLEATDNLAEAFDAKGYLYKLPVATDSQQSSITLDAGSKIDVSGVQVDLAMERNVIEVELRGNELADAPLQRDKDGFLYGKKVLVDTRKGTPLADISAALATVPKTVGERLTKGGAVQIRSAGEVVVEQNTLVDVSGGGIHYAAGYINTTNLISDGKVINIANADPARVYSGILGRETVTNKRFNISKTFTNTFQSGDRGAFVEAFDEGSSAGSFTLKAQAADFQGKLQAGTFNGPQQRQPGSDIYADGGSFNLELNLQNLTIGNGIANTSEDLFSTVAAYKGLTENPAGLFATDSLDLSQDIFNQSGFSHYNLTARNGNVVVADKADLHLADGASLNIFAAESLDVNGRIQTAGGNVTLATGTNKGAGFVPAINIADVNRPIRVASEAVIDTSGAWINDSPLLPDNITQPNSQLFIDGGAVSLKAAGDLLLDTGSAIIANGGGWLNRLGALVAGKGGDISLSGILLPPPGTKNITAETAQAAQINLAARLSSYAFNQGGALNITAPSIAISDQAATENAFSKETLLLDSRFFQRGGFGSYSLTAKGSNEWISEFSFAGFTDIAPVAQNYAKGVNGFDLTLDTALALLPTGTNLQQALTTAVLPDYQRKAVNLSFTLADSSSFNLHSNATGQGVRNNNLIVPSAVRILADPKANISFTSNTSLLFNGVIKAHGGNVSFTQKAQTIQDEIDLANFDDVGIWLGSGSLIDVSSTFISSPATADGLSKVGKVVDAGTVSLSVDRGFVLAEQGSAIDISAKAYATERYVSDEKISAHIATTMQAAKAGTLAIKAAEGILFDGILTAQGAGYGALGGSFAAELNTAQRDIPDNAVGTKFEHYIFPESIYADRRIILTQSLSEPLIPDTLLAANLGSKNAIAEELNGKAIFDLNKLAAAGVDSYLFTSGYTEAVKNSTGQGATGRIIFDGDAALVAGRSIDLNATTISADKGRGLVVAPYIKIGLADGISQNKLPKFNVAEVSGGSGELLFAATNLTALSGATNFSLADFSNGLVKQKTTEILPLLNAPTADGLLNMVGHIVTQGADNVTLASAGDIRVNGLLVGDGKGSNARYLGSFAVANNLTLQADQIYPTTLTEFLFSSGQYNFSKSAVGTGVYKLIDASGTTELNAVNAVEFTLEYLDSEGIKQTSTELATTYEAYDFLAGKLAVGDTVVHPVTVGSDKPITKTITAINTAAKDATGNPAGKITILSGGKSSPVMSAAGTLIFDAPNIDQGGTLKAPFGRIVLNTPKATGAVVLRDGSSTSVSAENSIIPFGELDAAGALVYSPAPNMVNSTTGNLDYGVRLFNQSPEAKVVVKGSSLDLQKNAVIDLSGGGDLLSYRFVPGPGGSKDVLAAANSGKSFVILPSLKNQYAPYDPSIVYDSASGGHTGQVVGEKVYLSAMGNLPAGEYAILPASYALLPGAYLITPAADGQVYSSGQQVRRVDGTAIVAGRFTSANGGEYDSQFSGFVVEPGSIAQTRSEYIVARANQLFAATDAMAHHQNTPNDAASLVLSADKTLNLQANMIAKIGEKGLGAQLDIVSSNLLITDKVVAGSSGVQVLTEQLAGFDSILLGGSRNSRGDSGISITAEAQQVEVAKNTLLSAPTILLAVRGVDEQHQGNIILAEGAQVKAQAGSRQQAQEVTFYGDALLGVSSGEQLQVTQQSATKGNLTIAENASVQTSNGSLLLLSNNETQLNGDILMQGGALNIGAGRVSLGQVSESVTGLKFTNEALAKLKVDELSLTSASTIDLYGDVNLLFSNLILQADGFRGFADGNQHASLSATQSLQLRGSADPLAANSAALGDGLGNGKLSLSADTLVLDKGNLSIAGFDQLIWNAKTAFVGKGSGSVRVFDNKTFTLDSPVLLGSGAANTQVHSDGLLEVRSSGPVSEQAIKDYSGLGSRLILSGQSLNFAGNVLLPSGELTLNALGVNAENLVIADTGTVDVSGRSVTFDDTRLASNGGAIKLNSQSGSVLVNAGAKLNISGVSGAKGEGSDAGKLMINALQGQAVLKGTIAASSGSGSKGGSLNLALQNIADFSALIQQVGAGNFSEAFSLRVSSGDLTLEQAQQLKAHSVSLTADSGKITIAGTIDASAAVGEKGGTIALNASKDLNLQSTAKLIASSTLTGQGGDVLLSTSNGFIDIATAAAIDVSGGGRVILRAPRTQNNNIITADQTGDDVAIRLQTGSYLSDIISGAATVDVDAFKIYDLVAATSEIFNTSAVDGSSTLSPTAKTLLAYRDIVPFGAVCDSDSAAGCSSLINPNTSDYDSIKYYDAVAKGDHLPVGSVCGDVNGCEYTATVNDTAATIASAETQAFMQRQNVEHMETRLFGKFSLSDIFHLKPELELRSKGDLVVDQAIDFGEGLGLVSDSYSITSDLAGAASAWRYNDELVSQSLFDANVGEKVPFDLYTNGEAGVLTLRAEGNLIFNAPVSDGFSKVFSNSKLIVSGNGLRTELSNEKNGWSYHWAAGADLASADAMATAGSKQLSIANDVVLRTSTGDIALAASGDLLMGSNSAVYTAGRETKHDVFYNDKINIYDALALANSGYDIFDINIMTNASYAVDGGSIQISAGNNLTAAGSPQATTDWLQRAGGQLIGDLRPAYPDGNVPVTWAVAYDDFKQGIAALGGGDIEIHSGNTISNLAVSLPTTAINISNYNPITNKISPTTAESLVIQGGGDLSMTAGGDILSGQFFLARGKANITAGGDLIAAANGAEARLELADSQITIAAAGDVNIGGVINPTVSAISAKQTGSNIFGPDILGVNTITELSMYQSDFYTYAADSSLTINALSGNVSLSTVVAKNTSTAPFVKADSQGIDINLYPAQVHISTLQGDIEINKDTSGSSINLFPSVQGSLSLLAANNIKTEVGVSLNMTDIDPSLLPSVLTPLNPNKLAAGNKYNEINALFSPAPAREFFTSVHAATPLYTGNSEPVRIVSKTGDISNIRLVTPTHAWVSAGRDISNVTFEFQNVHESDVSIVKAGRDIVFATPRNPITNTVDSTSATQGIDIAGFGRLDVIAGGDIALGASRGITSIGAKNNPNLIKNGFSEESGADISLFAGLKIDPNYSGFTDNYLSSYSAPKGILSSEQLINNALKVDTKNRSDAENFIKLVSGVTHRDYLSGEKISNLSEQQISAAVADARIAFQMLAPVRQQQIAFRFANPRGENYSGDLIEFVTSARFGGAALDAATLLTKPLAEQHALALAAFKAAPISAQRELILQTYNNEVKQGGIQDVSGNVVDKFSDGFARSRAAIASLFPPADTGSTYYQGDISLIFSSVQTLQGGDINLIAPGGGIDVGVAAVGSGVRKESSELGLIALRSGSVNATVSNNISVNSSRVFSLDGGDILLWSSIGNIDAGRGAKSALSVPPPVINDDGSINFQAAVAGSGIRNSRFTPERSPGAVYLFAPAGVVNAGDAGIGSQGDVLIAAQQVIGADNIDVGGVSIGVPVATGISTGVATAGSATTSATDAAAKDSLGGDLNGDAEQRNAAFVTVDLLGFDF